MSETLERSDDLIDHTAMAVHQNLLNVLSERVSTANDLQRQAQAAYDDAQHRYQAAVFGRGGDRHKCKITLEDAARRLVVETESADAARSELAHQNSRTPIVKALAHKPLYEAHMRNWRDDIKRRDAAVAVLAGIDADVAADIAGLRTCNSIGLSDIQGMLDGLNLPNTWRDLKAHWVARRIDPDDPRHPAVLPTELTDEQAHAQGLVRWRRVWTLSMCIRALLRPMSRVGGFRRSSREEVVSYIGDLSDADR